MAEDLDAGLYASLERFERFFGQDFLREFLGQVPTEETAPTLRTLLSSATGAINTSLARGGYRVPVADADIDPALLQQAKDLLATHCCVLAGRLVAAGAVNTPKTLTTLGEATDRWLKEIEARSTDLLGVSRPAANVTPQATAIAGFVATGEEVYPKDYHRRTRWVGP